VTVQYDIASPPVDLAPESFSAIAGWQGAELEPALRSFDRELLLETTSETSAGVSVGDVSSAVGPGLDILWISGAALSDGFTLTGTATLAWTGTPPTQSRLAFQIKVAKLAVVGTEDESWGGIKALYR